MKKFFQKIKTWLSGLSFRTGMIVLGCCILCYLISFAQMALPISIAWKGIIWSVFFGVAKALQYSGLLIIGKEGLKRAKSYFYKGRKNKPETT